MKKVNVTVWSDFACPWCWIAKRRLEKAVLNLAGEVEVVITPKSYRLAKGMTPAEFKTVLSNKFGNAVAAERMMTAVAENGAMEGLIYNFETMRFGDTSDAHALVKSVGSLEDKQRLIERIYQAYTTDGIDIFDRQVLLYLAREIGLAETDVDFDSPQFAAEIAGDELAANRIGNGVPLFIFNDKLNLSGAQKIDVFESALLDAAIEVSEQQIDMAGATCGINGCEI